MAIWMTSESEPFYGTEQEYLAFMQCPSFEHCLGLLPADDKPTQLIEQQYPEPQKRQKKRQKKHHPKVHFADVQEEEPEAE